MDVAFVEQPFDLEHSGIVRPDDTTGVAHVVLVRFAAFVAVDAEQVHQCIVRVQFVGSAGFGARASRVAFADTGAFFCSDPCGSVRERVQRRVLQRSYAKMRHRVCLIEKKKRNAARLQEAPGDATDETKNMTLVVSKFSVRGVNTTTASVQTTHV